MEPGLDAVALWATWDLCCPSTGTVGALLPFEARPAPAATPLHDHRARRGQARVSAGHDLPDVPRPGGTPVLPLRELKPGRLVSSRGWSYQSAYGLSGRATEYTKAQIPAKMRTLQPSPSLIPAMHRTVPVTMEHQCRGRRRTTPITPMRFSGPRDASRGERAGCAGSACCWRTRTSRPGGRICSRSREFPGAPAVSSHPRIWPPRRASMRRRSGLPTDAAGTPA